MKFISLLLIFVLCSCYRAERNCTDFKTGSFQSIITIGGQDYVSKFSRTDELQIETFEGKTDSSMVRWINDCEVIFKTINPKGRADKKDIHLKILSTTDSTYVFEYNYVGESNKQQGIATKLTL